MPLEVSSSEQSHAAMPPERSPSEQAHTDMQPERGPSEQAHTDMQPERSPSEQSQTAMPQKRISSKHLSRDDRLRVLTLHKTANWDYSRIAKETGFSYNQVRYTCHSGDPTPSKRSGRPFRLSDDQVKELITFLSASETNRHMSCRQLAKVFSHWGVGYRSIKRALERSGFKR